MFINRDTRKVYRGNESLVVNDITYPRQVWKDRELLKSLNIYPYREVGVDSKYYWQGQENVEDLETETVCTYEAIPRLLDDRLEVNEDGTPMLDSNGNQIVTKGLKSALKNKVSLQYKELMKRPSVDTGLGFSVDGSYEDLQNFKVGKEFNLLTVKDVDGKDHSITIEDYDTIITAIKSKGLELYKEKWAKEQEIDGIKTLDELIAYENQSTKGV